ncbi:MAG: zinc ABC transporter substrate-binding protein [Thiohalocapsa sp. PB-PSB1]|jgi:zinc transport system substrate-binding protein|nr:MAG: zinc ABC transporter substrate-binding protein [Thiohalocapsa sp. PB-PSB1]
MKTTERPSPWPAIAALILLLPAAVLAQDKLRIYSVNYPLTYFAERLAGDLAEVTFPAPDDVDPAFWMPDTETIAAYQAADLILLNGADYAKWTAKVSLLRSRLVDTSRAYRDAYIRAAGTVTHSHGPGGEHDHGGLAFTTWLDLSQAAKQAEAIAQALIRKRPDAKAQIARNLDALKADLLALDARMAEIASTDPRRPLLGSHPVYQYLARRYGLNLKSVMWEPEEMPNAAQWGELERTLKDHPASWMLWEGDPARANVERLRALGIASLVVDPCANRPAEGDFLSVMTENANNLERVFGHQGGAR